MEKDLTWCWLFLPVMVLLGVLACVAPPENIIPPTNTPVPLWPETPAPTPVMPIPVTNTPVSVTPTPSLGIPDSTGTPLPTAGPSEFDTDGDGWPVPGDCDDLAPKTHPGGTEICGDGADNDCNGLVDGSNLDMDGDGYTGCVQVGGVTDCNDSNATVYPGSTIVTPGADGNCDGVF